MNKQSKKLDLSQLAKRIVDEATGEVEPEEEIDEKKKEKPVSGKRGGEARAKKLSPKQRSEIAKKAAQSRWKSKQDEDEAQDQVFPPVKKKHISV